MRCAGCHHPRDAHGHYRPGTECSICECPSYLAPLWWVLLNALRRRDVRG